MFSVFYWTFSIGTLVIMTILTLATTIEVKKYFNEHNLVPKKKEEHILPSLIGFILIAFCPILHVGILFEIITDYDELKRRAADLVIKELS